MALELKNVLITGASGFIGTHLTNTLRQVGISYFAFAGDLLDTGSIRDFFDKNPGITQIVHLVGTFEGDLDRQLRLNFDTTRNLLEVAHAHGVRKVIYASTGAVYGEPLGVESLESDILHPNTWYGLSKVYAEDIVRYYTLNYDMQSVILRFPNVYGKGSRGVIPTFLSAIKEKGKITLYGDGEQSRHFLHVSDAIEAIRLTLSYELSDVFNITNPLKVSLNELIHLFKQNYEFEVEYLPKNNTLKDVLLSPQKAKDLLGFESQVKHIIFE